MKAEQPEIKCITCGITIEITRSWPRVRPEVFVAMAHDRENRFYECYNSHIKGIPGLPVGIMCLFSDWHSFFGLIEVVRRAWAVLSYIQIHNPNEQDTFNTYAARWYKDMVSTKPDRFPLDFPLPFAGETQAGIKNSKPALVRIGESR